MHYLLITLHTTAAVLSYLDLKDELRKKPNNKGLREQLEPLLEAIIELVPTPDKRTDLLLKLDEQKDKKVCDSVSTHLVMMLLNHAVCSFDPTAAATLHYDDVMTRRFTEAASSCRSMYEHAHSQHDLVLQCFRCIT